MLDVEQHPRPALGRCWWHPPPSCDTRTTDSNNTPTFLSDTLLFTKVSILIYKGIFKRFIKVTCNVAFDTGML